MEIGRSELYLKITNFSDIVKLSEKLDENGDEFVYLSELQRLLEHFHVNDSINIAAYLFDEAKSKGEFNKDKII